MTIGERIKKRRIELGLSVDDVAEGLGKGRATVYRYENGEIKKFPATILKPLAIILKTTPAYLLGWDRELDDLDWKVLELYPDYNPKNGYISNTVSSKHEQEVLNAYRKAEKPLRDGIDRMLGVEPITVAPEPQTNDSSNLARIAAFSGGTQNIPRPKISDEELNKMVEEAERDNLLAEIRASKNKKS